MKLTLKLITILMGATLLSWMYQFNIPETLIAQEKSSQWDGIFTDEQAQRGEPLYTDNCEVCHSGGLAPDLAGDAFRASWNDSSVGDLFELIKFTMPQHNPGSLTEQQYADILAYVLGSGGFPSGQTELLPDIDTLSQITFLAEMDATDSADDRQNQPQSNGTFTEEQARRGEVLYIDSCEACHGVDLTGGGIAPGIAGPIFNDNWKNSLMSELFERVQLTMPQHNPGSLTRNQTADILAFVLETNGFPSGASELPTDENSLNAISFPTTSNNASANTATEPASQWLGIYTTTQAERGQSLYVENCEACHSSDLAGSSMAPGLVGNDFNSGWNESAIGELFELIKFTMPQHAPGSLTDQQYADVLSFLLQIGNFPSGDTELPSDIDTLNEITFLATKP